MTSEMWGFLDIAEAVAYEGEPLTAEDLDLDTDDVHTALDLYRRASRQAAAAKHVEHACGELLAELLGEGGAVRMGPTIVRYHRGWVESCIDPDGFAVIVTSMARAGVLDAGKLMNPNSVRKTALPKAVRDTFFEKRRADTATLSLIPLDRAPTFLQGLGDGEAVTK